MANVTKVTVSQWIAGARQALLEVGIGGIRVDSIAKSLGVTRGGFYHHFTGRKHLLACLLEDWAVNNRFLPMPETRLTKDNVPEFLTALIDHHIDEIHFSPAYEMAVREWGRIDPKVKQRIDKVDEERITALTEVFDLAGYAPREAFVRARVLYLHQMGYYSLNLNMVENKRERRAVAALYMQILCGPNIAAEKLWPPQAAPTKKAPAVKPGP